jgi:hypothetical protein
VKHFFIEIRHKKYTEFVHHNVVKQYEVGRKGQGRVIEGVSCLKCDIFIGKIPIQNPTEQ